MTQELKNQVQACLDNQEVFALTRVPGMDIKFFEGFSDGAIEGEHVLVQSWNKETPPVFIGIGEKRSITSSPDDPINTSFEEYSEAFRYYSNLMKKGEIEKIVLSKVKKVERKGFSPLETFEKACSSRTDSFVYLIQHPSEGIWLGVSPEILLRRRVEAYETVSLAGTQEANKSNIYNWGSKEQIEQRIVTDQIREILNQSGADEISIDGPKSAKAGNVVHLKSKFHFQFKGNRLDLISSLHPTAAVAGLPRIESIELINKTEGHDRRLYTGYIGVNGLTASDIYVNLRCMQLKDDKLFLYLGGGLTIDSEVESEWEETELKANTLLNLIDGE